MGELQDKLVEIQTSLKAPKSQYNAFGKYKYRKAEDILEAVKPLLKQTGCTLVITDDIFVAEGRFYVKATATISKGQESISTTAYAREADNKSGMDAAQVTGATSSYARKYALNGLLCIDDNADPDVTNTGYETVEDAIKHIQKLKTQEDMNAAWQQLGMQFGNDQKFRAAFAQHQQKIANGTQK